MFTLVKRSRQYEPNAIWHERVMADGIDTKESALILAEVACSEHADMIMTSYGPFGDTNGNLIGFALRTSNATIVRYVIREG